MTLFGADDARPLENFADDLRALAARAEHVYVDAPAPAHHHHHHHHHRHNRHRAHHRRRAAASPSSSAATSASSLLKHYFSRGQRQRASSSSSSDDVDAESEPSSYFDVVPAWKRKPLSPLVGKLRCVKSAYEIEVMKASAEISARAHAKVSGVGVSVAYRSYLPFFSLFG